MRERLPLERNALTCKFSVGGTKAYMTIGFYDDGRPGELFLNVAKAGSTLSGFADAVATMVSVALQHGAPLETVITKLEYSNFEPAGRTNDPNIPEVTSLLDYVGRRLRGFLPEVTESTPDESGPRGAIETASLEPENAPEEPERSFRSLSAPLSGGNRTDGSTRPDMRSLFLEIAKLVAQRSTCPDGARHGAVLTIDDRIVSVGYGSPATGVPPCEKCWLRESYEQTGQKDWSVCPAVHAEANAITNAARHGVSVKGATLYITRGPCTPCQRLILNAGIAEIITEDIP